MEEQQVPKSELYDHIRKIRQNLGLTYPLDLVQVIKNNDNIRISTADFSTNGLRGIAYIARKETEPDLIFLSNNRTEFEQNLDCAHELVHLSLHRNNNARRFNSNEALPADQSALLEWQAEEGAAELIMPYKKFIPIFCLLVDVCQDSWELFESLKMRMATLFKVTPNIIADRIENLRYEIYQYEQGISIDRLHLISIAEQEANGIDIKSYNTIFEEIHKRDILNGVYHKPILERPRGTLKSS